MSSASRIKPRTIAIIAAVIAVAIIGSLLPQGSGDKGSRLNHTEAVADDQSSWKSIEPIARAFLESEYAKRYQYVLDGENLKPIMDKYYFQKPRGAIEVVDFDSGWRDDSIGLTTGIYRQDGKTNRFSVYARLSGGNWLVDWPATVGYNKPSFAAFIAAPPPGITVFRVYARLNDYYNYQYRDAKESYYSVKLHDNSTGEINGYVQKDSAVGKDMFARLSDGGWVPMTVGLICTGGINERRTIVG